MIGPIEVLRDVSEKLEKLKLNYFLVGSLASMYYSRPRFTNDIDLVIQVGADRIKDFAELFETREYYCSPIEVIRDEVIRRGAFNLIHQESGVIIDVILNKNSEISKSELSRRQKIEIVPGFEIFIATAEDVILKKLEFYREGNSEKHLSDVREIISSSNLDLKYIQDWVIKLGLQEIWDKAKF